MTATTMALTGREEAVVARDTGLIGRVTVTWAVAGGLALGGFLVAGMTLAGRLSGNALLMTAGVLYVIGAVLGFMHGAVLAFFGRPDGMGAREAAGKLGMAALYAVPALTVGFIAAGWIALTTVALYLDKPVAMVGAGVGWVIGTAIVATAAVSGWTALRNAYARWPDRKLGTVLVAATFAALLVLFLADRPELWGARLRVTEVGAVLLAALGAFWIAGPVVTVGLGLLRRMPAPAPVAGFDRAPRALTNIAIGLTAGALLGVVALPFHQAAFAPANAAVGTLGGAVLLVSRALVDEVLLRLFLVTGVAWLLLRGYRMPRGRAAVLAVIAGAAAQVVLYLPGVTGIGFATTLTATIYVLGAIALPAVVLGMLFWKRGFATALLADAAALVALALMI
jgi:hypothetical protein